ncbi:UDP-2,3-diacylglucosamine diphosphatase [Rhodoferax fermentans]|uniref:UDP-2,3-diacylglucosamine hydrolase n=1 Tax=Rhodoferax fermentans TaxID=28066 RepID=A0A1T1AYY3_RHOFE|nr:UDP-2,3-diacylglucosamine diphosphatase [Rhodoferax fermentans]MBK1682805.1 UDP-2,3-diacylglucosamine diphosphatase [Rhodoferax fermentans]OOV09257.1 UDP-2,3-diacylglucosamine diphosphatase [Rhodoferax fermentans]
MPSPVTASLNSASWPELIAPAHWRCVEVISDLHLQAGEAATFEVWRHYLRNSNADALLILGDLFEVWVGDDVAKPLPGQPPGFEAQCQELLAEASQHMAVFFMHGNRDFLLGESFAAACSMTLLSDPTVLVFDEQRWLLSHGDALCLDDTDYQQFRSQVRTPAWREQFLAKPLAERLAIARSLREQSESRKNSGVSYADVDTAAALQWLQAAQASTLIHGHTHKPADHCLNPTADTPKHRLVLSDWDAGATPPRLEVLRLGLGATPLRWTPGSQTPPI